MHKSCLIAVIELGHVDCLYIVVSRNLYVLIEVARGLSARELRLIRLITGSGVVRAGLEVESAVFGVGLKASVRMEIGDDVLKLEAWSWISQGSTGY